MTDHLTEDGLLAAIPGLTRPRLLAFIETETVIPLRRAGDDARAMVFRRVDCARIRLLCDLTDDLELDTDTLGIVIGLIDQLHARRQELVAIARVIAAEPAEVRARIGAALLSSAAP